eukprot:13000-Chlamydomonas_euryale.AAC.2
MAAPPDRPSAAEVAGIGEPAAVAPAPMAAAAGVAAATAATPTPCPRPRPNMLPDVAVCEDDVAVARCVVAVAGEKFGGEPDAVSALLSFAAADREELCATLAESGAS